LKCEIEFLAVGEGAKAGDAIVIRYGDVNAYELMLIDGGHAETGDEIVAHLKEHFGPNPVLEHVVLTHSDGDHASGLRRSARDNVRKDQLSVTRCTVHRSHSLAERA
jgi:glyoxylase-like metal-dependent hydrolase (beta-lactamase superfamily II)